MWKPGADHAAHVMEVATHPGAAARSRLAASWCRSVHHYGLSPDRRDEVRRIPEDALSERREKAEAILRVAMPILDNLHRLVGSSGCGVVLTDAEGIVLDLRIGAVDGPVFEAWGLAPGSDWSETSEGTNGIGTCIVEARPVIIHRDQHFQARNTDMSCIDAPIFGPTGELVGALDVSSVRADQTEAINRLIAAQVAQTARRIEADLFRASFPGARIVVAGAEGGDAVVLLAVDGDDLVRGATLGARTAFGLKSSGPIEPVPASDLFGREDGPGGFRRAERTAMIRALARAHGNVSQAARALGVGRATFYRRMKRLRLDERGH